MSNKNIVSALEKVLADSYFLYLKTQNYHWNVTGSNFKSLHELFGSFYEELSEAIDEIAERIRALGANAPGSFRAFSKLATIEEEQKQNISADEMIKQLIKDHDHVLKTIRAALTVAQKAGDDATADMLIVRIEAHDKNKWMLQSSL